MSFDLNLDAINDAYEELSTGKYLPQKDIPAGGDVELRLLPPPSKIGNGIFYLKVISFWINKKNYVSPATFNQPCPIQKAVKQVRESGNPKAAALLESRAFSESTDFILPVVRCGSNSSGEYELIGKPNIFQCSTTTIKGITGIVSDRRYQNGSNIGIFDPEKGRSVIVSKEVSGSNTSYRVIAGPNPFPIKMEGLDIPDVVKETKSKIYSDEYLFGVISSYLTNSPMPDESLKFKGKEKESSVMPEMSADAPKSEPKSNSPAEVPTASETSTDGDTLSIQDLLKQ